MARMYVISHRNTLRGVFTQKKKLWEGMGFDTMEKELLVAVNPTKYSELTYSKLCKYISERGILQIYDKDNKDEEEDVMGNLDNLKWEFMIWEVETNTFYNPPATEDDEEEDNEEKYPRTEMAREADKKEESQKVPKCKECGCNLCIGYPMKYCEECQPGMFPDTSERPIIVQADKKVRETFHL